MIFEGHWRAESGRNAFGRAAQHLPTMGAHRFRHAPRRRFKQGLQVFQVRRHAGAHRQAGGKGRYLFPLPFHAIGCDGRGWLRRQRFPPECREFRAWLHLKFATQQIGAGGILPCGIGRAPFIKVKADQVAIGFFR
jgi:hypothetical protein